MPTSMTRRRERRSSDTTFSGATAGGTAGLAPANMPRAETQSPPRRRRGRIVADWNVEAIGENTILVVRRHRGRWPPRTLARHDQGRTTWFVSIDRKSAGW